MNLNYKLILNGLTYNITAYFWLFFIKLIISMQNVFILTFVLVKEIFTQI